MEKLFCHRRQLGGRFKFQPRNCLLNCRKQSTLEVPHVVDCGEGSVATVGRLTAGILVATVGRLTAGRRDATGGRLISATSLATTVGRLISATSLAATVGRLPTKRVSAATVGRLTTKFGREDDAPPVPSAA